MRLKELGYLVLTVTSLEQWRDYGHHVVGAMVLDEAPGALRLRIDDRDCRILLKEGARDQLDVVGWLVHDEGAWRAAWSQAEADGLAPQRISPEDCRQRRVNAAFAVRDPGDCVHEIAWGPLMNLGLRFHSPVGVSSFVTGDLGLGHVVLTCEPQHYDATCEFMVRHLGLGVANIRKETLGPDPVGFPIAWLHCDNRRHHSVGLAPVIAMTQGHRCAHINFEVPTVDEVGLAYDRAERRGVKIARSLGRHVNDGALSFYMNTPSGFQVEYGCDSPIGRETREIVYDDGGVGSIWGHKWM